MSIWGKIVGGAAGFAFGGPIGALAGALAGHAVDVVAESAMGATPAEPDQAGDTDRQATKRIAFTIAVIVLGAKLAKADGVVERAEVAAFKDVFRIPPDEMRNVGRLFDRARGESAGFEPYARQIAGMFHRRSKVLEELLDGLFHIAKADGVVNENELEYLRRVAELFGFDEDDFARIRTAHLGPDEADPYRVLGVTREMSDAAIKAAYRKLVRECHPDKLIAKGMPKEFIDLANDKLAAINGAHERVVKDRARRRA